MALATVGKDRDEESGQYADTYAPADFFEAIRGYGGAASTSEIADEVGCSVSSVHRKLDEPQEAGRVDRREAGNAFLWMLANGEE